MVVVSCNNKGVMDAWQNGWSWLSLTNTTFKCLVRLEQEYGLQLRIINITTAINPANKVSRGMEQPSGEGSRLKFECQEKRIATCDFVVCFTRSAQKCM